MNFMEGRALAVQANWRSITALPVMGSDCPYGTTAVSLWSNPMKCAVKRAGGSGDLPRGRTVSRGRRSARGTKRRRLCGFRSSQASQMIWSAK